MRSPSGPPRCTKPASWQVSLSSPEGEGFEVVYSAAMPALANMSSPSFSASPAGAASSLVLAFLRLSKLVHTLFQSPRVAPFEYSVARVSKKLACSTPLSSGASQGRRLEGHTSEL